MTEYICSVELQDAYGRKTTKRYQSDPAVADFTTALSIASDLVDDLAALTELRVLAYTVGQRTIYADSESTGANKDEGATLVVEKTDNYRAVLKVPGPIQSVRVADGTIDISAAEVAAYIANFADGATRWSLSDGEYLTGIVSGRLDI